MLNTQALPEALAKEVQTFCTRWQDAAPADCQQQLLAQLQTNPALDTQLTTTIIASSFVAQQFLTAPGLLVELIASQPLDLQQPLAQAAIHQLVETAIASASNDTEFDKALRVARRDFMLRTIWRDSNRLASMQQTTAELSAFADACISAALNFHYRELAQQCGVPVGIDDGAVQPLLVLGMGKLGACELNLSSDIDLIFTYPQAGDTQAIGSQPTKSSISNQEFFARLGQKIIKSLDAVTTDGFVFRVDMRLRPYGQSGPLVANFDFIENYYQTQGREWERYAMIKARVVASTSDKLMQSFANNTIRNVPSKLSGAQLVAHQLMTLLQPFTFRKYLDYSAIDAMRAMKQLITREVVRKGIKNDVKLGSGGIREIEFIVQVFQLIRGGRDTRLQERQVLKVLPFLVEAHFLPAGIDTVLGEAYIFLRNTEHTIQAYQDRQTQRLPIDALPQLRLAWIMGFASWAEFLAQLQAHRDKVSEQFAAVIAEPKQKQQQATETVPEWELLWQNKLTQTAAESFFSQLPLAQPALLPATVSSVPSQLPSLSPQGLSLEQQPSKQHPLLQEAAAVLEALQQLRENHQVLGMQAAAREQLDRLMPILLQDLIATPNPAHTLQRIGKIIAAVARRSVYIVLLLENPTARAQLSKLCSASVLVGDQLAKHPALLDELLDTQSLYSPPNLENLRDELRREVLRISWDDLEAHMETLRYFRLAHGLRVAACEVSEALPLMKVSDYLTFIAEVILEHVLDVAWQQMLSLYGAPCDKAGAALDKEFVIVGYGKLGGIELGHGSDLDLVFIHNADTGCYTEGPKQIDNATFFTRLGQKIIHILNTQTPSGQLYEVDMRLRPSGNSGLLVSSITAFENYQFEEAWTWEHQALVRARVVGGSNTLADAFNDLRRRVLCKPRDVQLLAREVIEMREKMRTQLGSKPAQQANQFHLKQDAGGIVDIEFMVQYAVLAWAHQHPELAVYTDNIRILERLAGANLLAALQAQQLIDAYKAYRAATHRLALQGLPSVVAASEYTVERQQVSEYWQQLLSPPSS